MIKHRKNAEIREKELRLAVLRIKRGRSINGATRLSIAAVACEAGVSPALIHNHYPKIAEAIRREQAREGRGRSQRQQKLKQERQRARALRDEIADLRAKVARLASINEVLLADNESLRSRRADNVLPLPSSAFASRDQANPLTATKSGDAAPI